MEIRAARTERDSDRSSGGVCDTRPHWRTGERGDTLTVMTAIRDILNDVIAISARITLASSPEEMTVNDKLLDDKLLELSDYLSETYSTDEIARIANRRRELV